VSRLRVLDQRLPMFTGIIEEVGEIVGLEDALNFRTIRVRAKTVTDDLRPGSSVAVSGVCLTARSLDSTTFTADLSRETLERTTLGALGKGTLVNLERPLRADSRLGGHIVQGHVDGVGQIRQFERQADAWTLQVVFPPVATRYIVEKGSIAVDGISLTVASLRDNTFSIAIIPHTFDNTNLRSAKAGDSVNLEYDIVAKYVEALTRGYAVRID
jgi:riboflavin synthase